MTTSAISRIEAIPGFMVSNQKEVHVDLCLYYIYGILDGQPVKATVGTSYIFGQVSGSESIEPFEVPAHRNADERMTELVQRVGGWDAWYKFAPLANYQYPTTQQDLDMCEWIISRHGK